MPLNLKWSTQNYLKGKWRLLVADDLQMTVSFICVPFSGVKQEWGTCKAIHLRTCLKEFFPLSEGLRAGCFFFLFFFSCYSSPLHSTLLIRDHAYSPRRVLQRYNAPPQVQLSGVLHIFSAFSLCSPFLLFALSPSYLLVSLPVRHLSFYVLPTPHPFRFCLLPPTFASVLLFWWCAMHSLPRSLLLAPPPHSPSICICKCLFWSRGPQQIFNINEDPHEFLSSN